MKPQIYEDIAIEKIINILERIHKWKALGINEITKKTNFRNH